MATQEITFGLRIDPAVATAEMRRFTASVQANLQSVTATEKQQAATAVSLQRQRSAAIIAQWKQEEREAARSAQSRLREESRALRQKIAEEQRASREVARIVAETARQAVAQERLREQAAKRLADAQIREAKRAARELEKSVAQGRGGSGGVDFGALAGRVPIIGNLASEFTAVQSATAGAGAGVAAFAGAAATAAAGALALAGGVVAVGKGLFDLTKQTAEFEGKFFDLSQQVGVAVETLSALDVAAQRTGGGGIETVIASLGIFQRQLENAHDPTSEEAKLLARLGVTSLETEAALRQAAKGLFNLGEGAEQTDAVLQLFGRSGRFMNAILKESKGDLDQAAKGMTGMLVTREAAAAADLFNDTLGDTNRLLAGIARTLVSETIPIFTVFLQDINKALTGNANNWRGWAEVVEAEVAGVIATVKSLTQLVASRGTLDFGVLFEANLKGIIDQARKVRAQILTESQMEFAQRLLAMANAGRPGDRPGADKAASAAESRANKAIQLQQQLLEELTRSHRAALERERDLDLQSIEEWEAESIKIWTDREAAQKNIFEQEIANVQRFVKDREGQELAIREIELKALKFQAEVLEGRQKIDDEVRRRRDQAELELNRQLAAIRETARQGELQRIEDALERQEVSEEHAAVRRLAILKDAQEERTLLIDLELKQISTSAARKIQLDNEKLQSEQRYTDEFKRLTQERIDALLKEGAQKVPAPGGRVSETTLQDFIDKQTGGAVPPVPLDALIQQALEAQGVFAGLVIAIADSLGAGAQAAIAIAETMGVAFSGVAQAVGEAVRAFVLFGSAQGGFRKFAAEVIASIAQMAVVQALWEAAQGLAMLALTWFTGNPKYAQSAGAHFAAAAAYGLIAGVAVPLGRAVAGNTFQQQGGGGGLGGGRDGSPQPLQTITQDRNRPQQVVIILRSDLGQLDKVITASVVRNIGDGGEIREAIQTDGR